MENTCHVCGLHLNYKPIAQLRNLCPSCFSFEKFLEANKDKTEDQKQNISKGEVK